MLIIEKSIQSARSIIRDTSTNQHFAFIYAKNKLISIGQNNTTRTNNKGLKIAKRFNAKKHILYPYIHAEIDAIARLWGKIFLCKKHKLVSIRLNRHGELRISKPCINCSIILSALNLQVVYFDGQKFIYEQN